MNQDLLYRKVSALVDSLPEDASVTLPRRVLRRWLGEEADGRETATSTVPEAVADLTVPDLAEALGRAESTVRGWLPDVDGAYKLGGEWRVPRTAWRAHLERLAQDDDEDDDSTQIRSRRTARLSDWRRETG